MFKSAHVSLAYSTKVSEYAIPNYKLTLSKFCKLPGICNGSSYGYFNQNFTCDS